MRFYTSVTLSDHISKTPEGYLLCRAVPIARTGWLEYAAGDLPDDMTDDLAPDQKIVRVQRDAADLFAPDAVASYEGKPLTIDHPEDFVYPDNYQTESRGHVQNVRRGAGAEDDLLLADILVMDEEAIALVTRGLRELSCGYDAEYKKNRPGEVRQVNFTGNHVALVDRGRCGPRCAIKDTAEDMMTKKASWFDKIMGNPKVRRAMRDAEAEELKTGDEEAPVKNAATGAADTESGEAAPATDNAVLLEGLEEIKLLLRSLVERGQGGAADDDGQVADEGGACAENAEQAADEDPAETADNEAAPASQKTGDRRRTADADTVRRAVQLAPALRFRLGDSLAPMQRTALRSGMRDAEVSRVVAACLGRHTVDSAPAELLNAAFAAAAAVAGGSHNKRTADALTQARAKDKGASATPAAINTLNRDFYAKK